METSSRDQALGRVVEFAKGLGHELHGEVMLKDLQELTTEGYRFSYLTGQTYLVHGAIGSRYLLIEHRRDIRADVARNMSESEQASLLDTPLAEPQYENENPAIVAARAKLDTVDSDTYAQLVESMNEVLHTTDFLHAYNRTPNQSISGFRIVRYLFPYEEDDPLTIKEFERATRVLSTRAAEASEILVNELDVIEEAVEDDELPTDDSEMPGRGFQ